ncbi:hypothetical protein PALU110988_05015 [Paenibacillus lupini]|nr:hypothetical protein [Paenibacillus lupini]
MKHLTEADVFHDKSFSYKVSFIIPRGVNNHVSVNNCNA